MIDYKERAHFLKTHTPQEFPHMSSIYSDVII